jgi:hypothetical protein
MEEDTCIHVRVVQCFVGMYKYVCLSCVRDSVHVCLPCVRDSVRPFCRN